MCGPHQSGGHEARERPIEVILRSDDEMTMHTLRTIVRVCLS